MVPQISMKKSAATLPSGMRHIIMVPTLKEKPQYPAQVSELSSLLKKEGFSGKKGEQYTFNDGKQYLHFIGLGDAETLAPISMHKPLGNAVKAHLENCKQLGIVPGYLTSLRDDAAYLEELTITGLLASYSFDKYRTKKKEKKAKELVLILDTIGKDDQSVVDRAAEIARSIGWTRDIVNEPSNTTTPKYLAYLLKSAETRAAFRTEIFDTKKIQGLGMNLIYAVGKGSKEQPYFAKVTYMGNKKNKKFIALVGKGVNFDCGGIQVKPDMYMNNMKGDMGGAALVMGTMHALARIKANVNVVAYLPFVENMADGAAYRPDDVYTAYNGKTVEIKHTDAEGRLILADALAYASGEHPTEIIDFATLTGAVVVALGSKYAGTMGTNQQGIDKLQSIGKEIGELTWQLPMHEDFRKLLHSDIADIANISERREAGTILGAEFLKEFVGENIPWIHMDIAGVATGTKYDGIHSEFATGFGVRLMVEYLTRD